MSIQQRQPEPPGPGNGGEAVIEQLDALGARFGNRFLLEPAPDDRLPEHGMPAVDAMRLIGEELVLDGIPMRNLATFVTTWMEPEAQRVIADNLLPQLHRPRRVPAAPPRSSSAASACSPTSSTRPGRRPARGPRAPPRRSCSAPCR